MKLIMRFRKVVTGGEDTNKSSSSCFESDEFVSPEELSSNDIYEKVVDNFKGVDELALNHDSLHRTLITENIDGLTLSKAKAEDTKRLIKKIVNRGADKKLRRETE